MAKIKNFIILRSQYVLNKGVEMVSTTLLNQNFPLERSHVQLWVPVSKQYLEQVKSQANNFN